jgi:repressor LexA
MKDLTDRQREVLAYITRYIAGHKFPPTVREVADHFAISVKGAYDHIKAIEKKGHIRLDINKSRTIEVVREEGAEGEEAATRSVPILGTVAAGKPIFAEENFEGEIAIPAQMLKRGNYFALRVRGDSMRDAGILSGDYAIIQERETAENGEIVVAMVDEAVTLKRFFKERNRVKLQAENPAYPPLFTTDVRVLGKLAGIIRNYD